MRQKLRDMTKNMLKTVIDCGDSDTVLKICPRLSAFVEDPAKQDEAAFIGRMLMAWFSSLESVGDDELRSHIAMGICAFADDRGENSQLFEGNKWSSS
jgi:hypothetical protein